MKKVVVLGISGMLGRTVFDEFNDFDGQVAGSLRDPAIVTKDNESLFYFDAASRLLPSRLDELGENDFLINCIGLIKTHISDDSYAKRENAIILNSELPYALNRKASEKGFKIIQIATDCVFSGMRGHYCEDDYHDAQDVYGKTKSLGEVPSKQMMHLRTSIIGVEFGRSSSLLEWVRNQPKNARINGYVDHYWNGLTTKHFAKICRGIIEGEAFRAGVFHVVPEDEVTKHELVSLIAEATGRDDIEIEPIESGTYTNRTLATFDVSQNMSMWGSAGYSSAPTIRDMIEELELGALK
jgi:dTDP-4-dehydrorhamnose reductase